jgi:hypothetical protein
MGCKKTRGGGLRRGAPVVIRAQRKVCRSRRRAHQQRLRSKLRHSYYSFLYISAVRVVNIPTPYVLAYLQYLQKYSIVDLRILQEILQNGPKNTCLPTKSTLAWPKNACLSLCKKYFTISLRGVCKK